MAFFRALFSGAALRRLQKSDLQGVSFPRVGGDYRPYYRDVILPQLKKYEAKRIGAVQEVRRRFLISVPASILILAFVLIFGAYLGPKNDIVPITVIMGLFTIGICLAWVLDAVRLHKDDVKRMIYPLIFKFFDLNYSYEVPENDDPEVQPESWSSPGIGGKKAKPRFKTAENLAEEQFIRKHRINNFLPELRHFGIFSDYNNGRITERVAGNYHGVGIDLIQVQIASEKNVTKGRNTPMLFHGIVIVLTANKKFQGRTLIKRDLGLFNSWQAGLPGQERIKLEDPLFEDKFEVFSDNQVEARYLLTTSFMDRLLKLIDLFGGKHLEASFSQNQLLIAIPTKRQQFFRQSSIFIPSTFVEDINTVLKEMKIFLEIIEILKLDEKTGL